MKQRFRGRRVIPTPGISLVGAAGPSGSLDQVPGSDNAEKRPNGAAPNGADPTDTAPDSAPDGAAPNGADPTGATPADGRPNGAGPLAGNTVEVDPLDAITVAAGRRDGWRLLRSCLAAERRALILGSIAGLVWTVAKIAVPVMAGVAVDRGIVHDHRGQLLLWSLLIVGVGLVQAVTTGLRRYQAFTIAYRVETDLRQRLFAHLQRLHFALPRPGPDRSAAGPLGHRPAADQQPHAR